MPQLENAKKAYRQSLKRRAYNKTYKNRIKRLYRELSDLSRDGKKKEATALLPAYYKAIDKATKKNILHKNTASRKKSFATKMASGVANEKSAKSVQTEETTAAVSNSEAK